VSIGSILDTPSAQYALIDALRAAWDAANTSTGQPPFLPTGNGASLPPPRLFELPPWFFGALRDDSPPVPTRVVQAYAARRAPFATATLEGVFA